MSYQYTSKTRSRHVSGLSQTALAFIGLSLHSICGAHIAEESDTSTSAHDNSHIESGSGTVDLGDYQGYFSSIVDAVVDASNQFNPNSIAEDREYMGAVLKQKSPSELGEVYTYTVTAGLIGSPTVTIKLAVPKDYEIVAFWHTHGKAHWSRRYFSDVDTSVANSWGVPFYLADYTGTLKVYTPGAKLLSPLKARNMGLGRHKGYAKGNRVKNASGLAYRIDTVKQKVDIAKTVSNETVLAGQMENARPI